MEVGRTSQSNEADEKTGKQKGSTLYTCIVGRYELTLATGLQDGHTVD